MTGRRLATVRYVEAGDVRVTVPGEAAESHARFHTTAAAGDWLRYFYGPLVIRWVNLPGHATDVETP